MGLPPFSSNLAYIKQIFYWAPFFDFVSNRTLTYSFIIGQVTPDMLAEIRYGTYIFFGLVIFIGAGFIWFFVPETKRLTLEEMDSVFGSEGVAQADFERMEEINREIGLTQMLMNGIGYRPGSNLDEGAKPIATEKRL